MAGNTKRSLNRNVARTDLLFGVVGLGSVALLTAESFSARPSVPAPDNPVILIGVTLFIMILLVFLIPQLIRIDRRKADEYASGIIGHSAVIAVVTTIISHMFLGQGFLLGGIFGKMSADSMLGVLNGSWAISYFIYRVRGTVA